MMMMQCFRVLVGISSVGGAFCTILYIKFVIVFCVFKSCICYMDIARVGFLREAVLFCPQEHMFLLAICYTITVRATDLAGGGGWGERGGAGGEILIFRFGVN